MFQSFRDGNSELYVMNADGSNQTRLTNTSIIEELPDWSPDGTKIVYGALVPAPPNSIQSEIYVMNANGSNQTPLAPNPANDLYPRWSPDGTRIAFFSQRSPGGIFVMKANGTGVTPLVVGDEPDWSADGTRLAFLSDRGVNVVEADGTGAVRITDYAALNFWPRWRP